MNPMRFFLLLLVATAILTPSCKKKAENATRCDRKIITSYKTNTVSGRTDSLNEDDYLAQFTAFNGGQLLLPLDGTETFEFDAQGRMNILNLAFTRYGRQTRNFYYDDQNRIVQTMTRTGDGNDYMTYLKYENGDVTEQLFSVQTGGNTYSSKFRYTYYETPCVNQFFAFKNWQ